MATHVSGQSGNGAGVSSFAMTYSPTAKNAIVIGVLLVDGIQSILNLTDNLGINATTKIPINIWQRLGIINSIAGTRVEMWGCMNIAAGTTAITATLSGTQSYEYALEEYSGANAFGPISVFNAPSILSLSLTTVFSQNSDLMVSFFNWSNATTVTAPVTTPANGVIRRQVEIISLSQGLAALDNTNPICAVATTGIVRMNIQAISVTLISSIVLKSQPGFSDIPDASWAPGKLDFGVLNNRVSTNGALGMCRLECFIGSYVSDDIVALPISPVDGYAYQRDELLYFWSIGSTFDKATNWITGGINCLFYAQWGVKQWTDDPKNAGTVICEETYGGSGSNPKRIDTNNGQLTVMTIAQRRMTDLFAANFIDFSQLDPASYASDQPFTQNKALELSRNSKFCAVSTEVIYMGQFTDTGQLAQPVSPVDGRVYRWDECHFLSSWIWLTNPNSYTQPPSGWDELQGFACNVSSTGLVTVDTLFYNNGIIDPEIAPNGLVAFGRVAVFAVCQRSKGPYWNVPTAPTVDNSLQTANTFFMKMSGFTGSTTGKITVSFKAGPSGAFNVSKVKILATLVGSTAVTSSVSITFSAGSASFSLSANGTIDSDQITTTFDNLHDYYLVMYTGSPAHCAQLTTPFLTPYAPTGFSNGILGDQTGVTTIPAWDPAGSVSTTSSTVSWNNTSFDSQAEFVVPSSAGFTVGAMVTVDSNSNPFFNGTFPVTTVPDGTHVYLLISSNLAPQTGTGGNLKCTSSGIWFAISGIRFDAAVSSAMSGFSEIDATLFNSGQNCPYTLIKQMAANIAEGCNTPEVFGPTNYVNGNTVALPTSPADGYTYVRGELTYLWTWNSTGPNSSIRLAACESNITAAGLVQLNTWSVPSGSQPTEYHNGSIDVIVIATRANLSVTTRVPPARTPPTQFPPIDVDLGNLHVTTSLNGQGSLAQISSVAFTYTATATSVTWSWGAFTIYSPDGSSIAVGTGSYTAFTGLTASTRYYFCMYYDSVAGAVVVIKGVGTALVTLDVLALTVNGDGNIPIETQLFADTPASGSSGGGGGGGRCFSPNTRIKTSRGVIPFFDLQAGDFVLTAKGTWRRVKCVLVRQYDGPAYDMGDGEFVTAEHFILIGSIWIAAEDLYRGTNVVAYSGKVINCHVETEPGDDPLSATTEHSYTLGNGLVVHNFLTT